MYVLSISSLSEVKMVLNFFLTYNYQLLVRYSVLFIISKTSHLMIRTSLQSNAINFLKLTCSPCSPIMEYSSERIFHIFCFISHTYTHRLKINHFLFNFHRYNVHVDLPAASRMLPFLPKLLFDSKWMVASYKNILKQINSIFLMIRSWNSFFLFSPF